jgi:hypothetical protein
LVSMIAARSLPSNASNVYRPSATDSV